MMTYTLAFIFNEDLSKVLLLKKTRPEWQAGHLNGIGGKCEPNEPPLKCIQREVFEECGLENIFFEKTGIIAGDAYIVYVYNARISSHLLESAVSKTDEIVSLYDVSDLHNQELLPSVKYLIPMSMQPYLDPNFMSFTTNYG